MRTQLLFMIACAVALPACDDGYSSGGNGNVPGHDSVTVSSNKFTPTAVIPDSAGTVVWSWNSGGVAHNITFEDAITGSGDKTTGTFSHTFAVDGTYRFRCTHHSSNFTSGMVGAVVVGAPDPPDPYPY